MLISIKVVEWQV